MTEQDPYIMRAETARGIMGAHFFGVDEAKRCMNVFGENGSDAFADLVPEPRATAEALRETHLLIAIPAISLTYLRTAIPYRCVFDPINDWYLELAFSQQAEGFGRYHWLRQTVIRESCNKTWDEQQGLLGPDEEVPSARTVCYAMAGIYCTTEQQMFQNTWTRTSDTDPEGDQLVVGFIGNHIVLAQIANEARLANLGITSARKANK